MSISIMGESKQMNILITGGNFVIVKVEESL